MPHPPRMTHEQFMRLFLQSERELLRYVMAIVPNVTDARDVVQDTALALWKQIDKYDPARPFIPWACRFALNEARMFLRTDARRRRRCLAEDVVHLLEARRVEVADDLDARRQHLATCMEALPERHRCVVQGYYFDDETVETLAARLGKTVDAIYKALQRIRQALQQCIEQKLSAEA